MRLLTGGVVKKILVVPIIALLLIVTIASTATAATYEDCRREAETAYKRCLLNVTVAAIVSGIGGFIVGGPIGAAGFWYFVEGPGAAVCASIFNNAIARCESTLPGS